MASIIKVLLSFKNDVIPGNLYFKNPNPFIQWDKSPVKVVESNSDWENSGKKRRVGINGFGFGVRMLILLLKSLQRKISNKNSNDPVYILKLSAKTEDHYGITFKIFELYEER